MFGLNRIYLMGTLVRDPEYRVGGSGDAKTDFRIAVDDSRRNRSGEFIKKTLFIDVIAFGAQAESVQRYLNQGSRVLVEGRLILDEWKTRDGQERSTYRVVASSVQFLDPPSSRPLNASDPASRPGSSDQHSPSGDIPFL
ncbi:MAG: single-stranded DNA-binding protein [Kiritimatiellia bacterium]